MHTKNVDDQQNTNCEKSINCQINVNWERELDMMCEEINDLYDNAGESEEDYFPVPDQRVYQDGIKGNGYDSLYEYRKEFFKYIEDFE